MPDIKPFHYVKDVLGVEDILCPSAATPDVAVCSPMMASNNLDEFQSTVMGCTKCRLSQQRTNIVFGEGSAEAKLMFIGEGPGFEEDQQGRPFVGKAGQLLTKMIQAMGLKREAIYIANIVKCRPPENRNPFNDEIQSCIPYVKRQIELIKPEVIICLGSVATKALLNSTQSISRMRGVFVKYNNIPVMPTFHPAYLLRNEKMKKPAWEDLQQVMTHLGLPGK